MTALMAAIEAMDVERVRAVAASGISVEERDDEGRSPLVVAAGLGDVRVVEALLEAGARTDRSDRWGETSFHAAARAGRTQVLDLLLTRGGIFAMPGRDGMTPILAAISGGHAECYRRLLAAGADPLASSGRAGPALVIAARSGSVPLVEDLLRRGADPSDAGGHESPLRAALWDGHAAVVHLLLSAGARDPREGWLEAAPLAVIAARRGDLATLEALADGGHPIDERDVLDRDALDHARRLGHEECAAMLIARGLDPANAHPLDRLPAPERAVQLDAIQRLARALELSTSELLDVLECPLAPPSAYTSELVDLAPSHRALLAIADGFRLVQVDRQELGLRVFSSSLVDTEAEAVGAPRHFAPIEGSFPDFYMVDARTGEVGLPCSPDALDQPHASIAAWVRHWLRAA